MSDNKFCVDVILSTQNKKSDVFVCLVTKRRSVYRGSLDRTRGLSVARGIG